MYFLFKSKFFLYSIKSLYSPQIKGKLNDLISALKMRLNSSSSKQLKLLTSNDFLLMDKYEQIFEPVARALDVLQGEVNNSQGLIIPVLQSMKMRVSLIEENNNIIRDFKNTLTRLIDKRFGNYFEFSTTKTDFLLAAATLPRFKTNFIMDKANAEFVKNLLVLECKKMSNETNEMQPDIAQHEESSNQDDFIITFTANNNARRNSIENQIESEVSSFLLDSSTDTDSLNNYRNIKNVYYKYNTTLSSSAPVERVFSQTKMIFTFRRNRISVDTFEKTLMLKHNRMLNLY